MAAENYVPVCDLGDLEAEGRTVVSEDGQAIALFFHEDEVHAVDNRCPHMGFPLVRGTVEEGVLTCHWRYGGTTGIIMCSKSQDSGRIESRIIN